MSTRMRHIRTLTPPAPVDRVVKVSVHRDPEWREYRCRVYRDGIAYEPADYFTPDVEDALGTADAMLACEIQRLTEGARA